MEKKNIILAASIVFVLLLTASVFAVLYVGKNKTNSGSDGGSILSAILPAQTPAPTAVQENGCQAPYDGVLAKNIFDFSECTQSAIRTGNFDEATIKQKENNLIIIFDSSGSMAQKIGGRAKIDIAKEAVKKYIDKLNGDESLNLGMLVYGHKGSNSPSQKALSCAGIDEIYYLNKVHAEVAKAKIDGFSATGWTPIAKSLELAGEKLKAKPVDGKNMILLVSDGTETCDGNPVEMVKKLHSSGLNVTANVIGFDVAGAEEQALKNIAAAGGGDYFSVKNAQEFDLAFQKHDNTLKKANYKIGRTVEQIYDISNVMNQYGQCTSMLKREEAAMMLDIHASKLAGESCEAYADQEYWKRDAEITKKLEDNFSQDKQKFDALKGS